MSSLDELLKSMNDIQNTLKAYLEKLNTVNKALCEELDENYVPLNNFPSLIESILDNLEKIFDIHDYQHLKTQSAVAKQNFAYNLPHNLELLDKILHNFHSNEPYVMKSVYELVISIEQKTENLLSGPDFKKGKQMMEDALEHFSTEKNKLTL